MEKDGWKELVLEAVKDPERLDLLTQLLEESDEAKQVLRNKGYGHTGLSLLKTVEEEVPYSLPTGILHEQLNNSTNEK